MKNALKQLQVHIADVKAKINNLKLEISGKNKELSLHEKELKTLTEKLNSFEKKDTIISEHAYLRYFERVLGYDLEKIGKEILSEDILKMMETLGSSGKYPNQKGYRLVIKNNVVVTIEK